MTPSLHISLDHYRGDNTCIQLFPFKQAQNGTNRVFPHQPITHVVSSWHTQPACLLKKNIHTPMQIQPMGRFLPLSCLSLSLQTLEKSSFILAQLLRYLHFAASGHETTGIRYALAHVRGKFMANYVLISFLAEILELLLACTCLY